MKTVDEDYRNMLWKCMSGYQYFTWKELYDKESELMGDLKSINFAQPLPEKRIPEGYEFLKECSECLKSGKSLTQKQKERVKDIAYSVAFCKYINNQ